MIKHELTSALCANIGPAITSPIANIDGTEVWKRSLTGTRPTESNFMPTFSTPNPSVYGRRPVATRTVSASS